MEHTGMITGVVFPINNLTENKKHLLAKNGMAKHIFYADFIIRYYQSEIIWLLCSSETILCSADTHTQNPVSQTLISFSQKACKLRTEKSYTGLPCPSTHLPNHSKHTKSCRSQNERKNEKTQKNKKYKSH